MSRSIKYTPVHPVHAGVRRRIRRLHHKRQRATNRSLLRTFHTDDIDAFPVLLPLHNAPPIPLSKRI